MFSLFYFATSYILLGKTSGKQTRTATVTRNPMNGGVACPADEERDCDIDCEYVWKPWSTCNANTGKQDRSVTVTTPSLNLGSTCPPDETRNCDVDCVSTWGPWSTCDPETGKQNRQASVTVSSLNAGVACPADQTRDCPIDCTYNWNPWESCSQTTGKQSRSIIITTACKAKGNCPTGALFGGTACPGPEERDCPIDCQSTFTPWDTCNKNTGKQGRTVVISTPCKAANNCPVGSLHSGTACPGPETRICPIDCEYTWGDWDSNVNNKLECEGSDTTRTRIIQTVVTAKNGGVLCPPPETVPCDVEPCKFAWNEWGACDLTTGKQDRSATIEPQGEPVNGGKACPPPEQRDCTVDCLSDWNEWSTCDKASGTQTRDVSITSVCYPNNCPTGFLNGGALCKDAETRPCDIACEFTWPVFSVCDKSTGKQDRSPTISIQPKNSGKVCPDPDERNCDIDCEFTWPEWSICDKTVGKQGRSPTITVPALNGATACPGTLKIK